jgi:ferrous iron transport protein B
MKTFVLVGAPNSGKTTFYNWITGSNFKTVNYPGSTVEYSVGSIASDLGKDVSFIDTPGTYSLIPKSPDEEVTYSVLYDLNKENKNKNVILVLDGLHIERSLIMALQMKKAGFPFSIVITMDDLLKKYNKEFDVRKLSHLLGVDVFTFNGQSGVGLKEIVEGLKTNSNYEIKKIDWTYLDFQQAKVQLNEILSQIKLNAEKSDFFRLTQKIDGFALGKFGFVIFFLLMSLLFASLFWFSAPFSDGIEWVFNYLSESLDKLMPESLFREFLSKGVLSSFAAILVFVPQIFLLFFGLGILESTGYLPRAAALIDHPLRKMGLGGRSFVPLLSGFACAVPALMATRNITSKKERILSLFVIPLMSCSARIPVYGLLISFLIADNVLMAGLMMAGLYMLSLIVGAIAALILSRFIPASKDQYFLMELPLYRMPRWQLLIKQSIQKTKSYVVRAGPIIFVFAVLIWGSTQFPRVDMKTPDLAESYAGQMGHVMEPLFKPMGVDWRVGVGLISAFAAREVFVSSMAVTFKVTEDEDKQAQELGEVMKNASFANGDKIFTVGSVLGLIVFFMIALQCMSTVAVQVKESGSYKFAIGQLVILNVVGYALAVIINQTYSFLFK